MNVKWDNKAWDEAPAADVRAVTEAVSLLIADALALYPSI
jgi:hypothetical protein